MPNADYGREPSRLRTSSLNAQNIRCRASSFLIATVLPRRRAARAQVVWCQVNVLGVQGVYLSDVVRATCFCGAGSDGRLCRCCCSGSL